MSVTKDDHRAVGGSLRRASQDDLAAINQVIDAAVAGWSVAERVKRLALPTLRYSGPDFDDFSFGVIESEPGICAVAAWREESQAGYVLLHGLYVDPSIQRCGLGRRLINRVADTARRQGFEGILLRAERVAVDYFEYLGFERLEPEDPRGGTYPYRFWLPVGL